MAKRRHDVQVKRLISMRLQRIIEERFETLYDFVVAMEDQGRAALASTVRGWLPPQRLWKAALNGAAVRPVDWQSVKVPDAITLIEFCDVLSVRSEHILFGEGEASRGQTRVKQELQQDVAAHMSEALRAAGYTAWSPSEIDGERALGDIVAAALVEAADWRALADAAPARFAAHQGMLRERIGRMEAYLPNTDAARSELAALRNYGALLEEAVKSGDTPAGGRRMRYLAHPSLDASGFSLPLAFMTARVEAAVGRVVEKTLASDATKPPAKRRGAPSPSKLSSARTKP